MIDGLRNDQGNRFRKFFETKEAAKTWLANHKEVSLVEGRAGLEFTSSQRADARRALAELTAFPGATLTDAARHFAEYLRRTERTEPVSEVVAQFVAAKQNDGRSTRYLEDLRYRLGKFTKDFGTKPAAAVSTTDLDDWLHGLSVGPQSRVNQRRVLNALFEFACARGLARENPVTKTGKPRIVPKEPGILHPIQLARLLEAADSLIRPSIAIAAFSGLRPAEVRRLDWESVNLAEGFIAVTAMSSKTASRRLAPLPDNLTEWIMQSPSRVGPVVPKGDRRMFEAARKAAGIAEWPHDALRHSWASYRLALLGNAAQVAGEAGHQEAVLHRHYKQLVSRADAERWFEIRPSANVGKPIPFESSVAQA